MDAKEPHLFPIGSKNCAFCNRPVHLLSVGIAAVEIVDAYPSNQKLAFIYCADCAERYK